MLLKSGPNILLLSNNSTSKEFVQRLKEKNCAVKICSEPILIDKVKESSFDLVVSYNYSSIVKKDVIDYLGNKIMNMHISYLPWNRGASPNIWSFIDDTPKGVTIHRLEEKIDTGEIMFQKQLSFDENTQTLFSSYQKLQKAIFEVFLENLEEILTGNFKLTKQSPGGSYHKKSDLNAILKGQQIDYSMPIVEFKKFIAKLKKEAK